jgi:flagella basal body P-ring formation protein FlgA
MILKLTATDSSATTRTMIVSGRADIMVHCLTVNRTISVGDLINSEAVSPVDVMWKAAYGEPLSSADVSGEQRAARALVPGRPLCLNDVRNSKSVQPGEKITLRLSQGTVDITLAAHALTGGAIGDEISATVVGNPPRTFRGILESEGHLHVQLP